MISLIRHELAVRRRTILGWALGLGFFALMYMAFYPALPEEMRNLDMQSIDIYKSMGVESMASFDGYMRSTVFNFLPLLVGAFGIVLGAGALAGDEDAGTLELLAALPISRLGLYAAKAASILAASFLVLLAVALAEALGFMAIESRIETLVEAPDVVWMVLGHWLIAFVFIALGLALGAYMPSRGSALSVGSALLVLTFFGNNLAGLVTELESVKPALPFSYFNDFIRGMPGEVAWGELVALAAMAVVLLVLGALGFQRRDLTVGAWPWQRARPPSRDLAPDGMAVAAAGRRMPGARSMAVLAIAALACVGAVALASSEDLRDDVREWLGLEDADVLEAPATVLQRQFEALSPRAGMVVSVPAAVGDGVAAGAALAVIAGEAQSLRARAQLVLERGWQLLDELAAGHTDRGILELRAALDEALGEKAAADAARQLSRRDESGLPRHAELSDAADLAEAGVTIAEARLELAENGASAPDVAAVVRALERARAVLGDGPPAIDLAMVESPVAGTVVTLSAMPGDVVSEGQALASVAQKGSLELLVEVDGDQAGRLEEGDEVELEVDGIDSPVAGRIAAILDPGEAAASPYASLLESGGGDDDDRWVLRIALDGAADDLLPGARVDVRISLE